MTARRRCVYCTTLTYLTSRDGTPMCESCHTLARPRPRSEPDEEPIDRRTVKQLTTDGHEVDTYLTENERDETQLALL